MFKFPWRSYQQRVLDELEEHLSDNHLHVVAPPGSGKTILGLEVMRRLNKPALILTPSLAIRNQWIDRFRALFLDSETIPDWISTDIRNPGFLTVTTYQGLHAVNLTGSLEEEEPETSPKSKSKDQTVDLHKVIRSLRTLKLGTLVIDEAHHLKNSWWKSLNKLKKELKPTIVALTATPPYDVTPQEWQRYTSLNGPVDAEISVPELVKEGDLCPHQDYVLFSSPTKDESDKIGQFRSRTKALFREIVSDETLINALESHPIFTHPLENTDWIYSNLEAYSSTIIFLNSAGREIQKAHLKVIGDVKIKIPRLTFEWMEIVLNFYLHSESEQFLAYEEHQHTLTTKLKRHGVINQRRIRFNDHRKINSSLGSSLSKLKSIKRIVDFEYHQMLGNLRMVILTDYIRKEFLVNTPENNLILNKIGVLPIFEQLRRSEGALPKLGILTGSLIVIPRKALGRLKEVSARFTDDPITTTPLPYDDRFLVVQLTTAHKPHMVSSVTQIFQEGHIEVLIGTKSLLGEGWDAPAINSLILATFVGSYVLSNQMRGRAIRTNRNNTRKTGNIWHLVCLDPTIPEGGNDVDLLKRRFKAFVGVSIHEEGTIESGVERLGIPDIFHDKDVTENLNNEMLKRSTQRDQLMQQWKNALFEGNTLVEEIKVPHVDKKEYAGAKSTYLWKTIGHMSAMLGFGVVGYGQSIVESFFYNIGRMKSIEHLKIWVVIAVGMGVVAFGRMAAKTFRLYIRYRDISKDLQRIGESLLDSLIQSGDILHPRSELKVIADQDKFGCVFCHLEGGSRYDQAIYTKSLKEIVGVVESPRYVIVRKSLFLKTFAQKDYHSVPEVLGRNKENAEYFAKQWKKNVGSADLVYTRSPQGRRILLKSRIESLASQFQDPTERISKWK